MPIKDKAKKKTHEQVNNEIVSYSHQQLVTMMLKDRGINEGYWGPRISFKLAATNFGRSLDDVLPAAVVMVADIGLIRFNEPSHITVDAAKVNPKQSSKSQQPIKQLSKKRRTTEL